MTAVMFTLIYLVLWNFIEIVIKGKHCLFTGKVNIKPTGQTEK